MENRTSSQFYENKFVREYRSNFVNFDEHKPVSRQLEEEYHRYYGWPYYWDGDGLWGMSGFPILAEPSGPFDGERRMEASASRQRGHRNGL